jgi:hypothetical protein
MGALFGGGSKPQAPTPTPQVDEARMRVEETLRQRRMKGRAATMLSSADEEAPTAKRNVMGY